MPLVHELREYGYPEDQVLKIVRAVGGAGFNLNLFPNSSLSRSPSSACSPRQRRAYGHPPYRTWHGWRSRGGQSCQASSA